MREAEKGYEDWLKRCQKLREIEEVDLINESYNSDRIISLMMSIMNLITLKIFKF